MTTQADPADPERMAGTADLGQDGTGHRDAGASHRDTDAGHRETGGAKTGSGPARWAWRARVRRRAGAGSRRVCFRRACRALSRPGPWRRGLVLAALALLLGLLMLLHARITDHDGLGSLVESLLPWLGLFVPVLLIGALWRRSASAVVALLLPVVAWLYLFGGLLGDRSGPAGDADLTVAEHNVDAGNPDPAGTARDLAASHADLLALVELTPRALGTYEKGLAKAYPYHTVRGTVGLWSRWPLSDTRPIDITDFGPLAATKPAAEKLPDNRALRTTVATDRGPLAVYVAHLGSVRLMPRGGFWTAGRDRAANALAASLAAERNERVVLLGDLNGTTDDRALAAVTSRMRSVQADAGNGFGFTWPARFPVARIDQILVRGVRPQSSSVLPATGSDHLPVAAGINW